MIASRHLVHFTNSKICSLILKLKFAHCSTHIKCEQSVVLLVFLRGDERILESYIGRDFFLAFIGSGSSLLLRFDF